MMKSPGISVIIPCYNSERFIERAIDSVLSQTYSDWELLLIDNNSTDGTANLLTRFEKAYPGKIYVYAEQEPGAPHARNKGLQHARGAWVQFLDADDELLPDKLSGQLDIALQNPVSFVASPYTICGFKEGEAFTRYRALNTQDPWIGLAESMLGITSANLFNRALLEQVGGWDPGMVSSQEYDLMFRMLQVNPSVGYDDRNLTIVHIEPGVSVSRTKGKERAFLVIESRVDLRLRVKDYLAEGKELTRERAYYLDRFVFRQLFINYRSHPKEVSRALREIELDVDLKERLRAFYFMRKMDIKRIVNRIRP